MNAEQVGELIESVAAKYRGHWDPPIVALETPHPRPSAEDWSALAARFDADFPPVFVHFMNVMAGFDTPGHLDVAGDPPPHGECTMAGAYDHEMGLGAWDADLIPFNYVSSGDYHCLSARAGAASPVYYVCHEEDEPEQIAPSFEAWLAEIETHLGAPDEAAEPPPSLHDNAIGTFIRDVLANLRR